MGLSSALDYRSLQLEYTNTQYDRLTAIYELLVSELEIQRLVGELTDKKR